jgi:hypothetical protein
MFSNVQNQADVHVLEVMVTTGDYIDIQHETAKRMSWGGFFPRKDIGIYRQALIDIGKTLV